MRLWIELLKNAYYKKDGYLETLPNIDINIKCGNSLISRFALDADLSKALKSIKYDITAYRGFVNDYKNCKNREIKRGLQLIIDRIKADFRTEIAKNDPLVVKLNKASNELYTLLTQIKLFADTAKIKRDKQTKEKLEADINKWTNEINEIKNNAIYKNAFEWRFEFPEVLNNSGDFEGFDTIIGNPPYISIQDLKEVDNNAVKYYKNNFESTKFGNYDIYIPFIELSYFISNERSNISFIIPSKFLTTDYGTGIRKFLLKNEILNVLVDFEHYQVFDNATIYTCILMLSKGSKKQALYAKANPKEILNNLKYSVLNYRDLENRTWVYYDDFQTKLIRNVFKKSIKLSEIPCEISRGSSTGDDKVYVLTKQNGKYFNGYNEAVHVEEETLIKPIYATDFTRYLFKTESNKYLIFPYTQTNGRFNLIDELSINNKYPLLAKYLTDNKGLLEKRKQFNKWYGYSAARNLNLHSQADILIPLLADRGLFALNLVKNNATLMAGGGFSISIRDVNIDKRYLLALLNSKLLFYLLYRESNKFRGGYITCTKQYFENLPIKVINTEQQQSFINIVDKIITGKKAGQDTIELEQQIDALVYHLYELTPDEIAIVEGSEKL